MLNQSASRAWKLTSPVQQLTIENNTNVSITKVITCMTGMWFTRAAQKCQNAGAKTCFTRVGPARGAFPLPIPRRRKYTNNKYWIATHWHFCHHSCLPPWNFSNIEIQYEYIAGGESARRVASALTQRRIYTRAWKVGANKYIIYLVRCVCLREWI